MSILKRGLFFLCLINIPLLGFGSNIIPAPPKIAATSWVLMDGETGEILAEHNSEEQLPPASLTKMMTSYIASLEIKEGRINEEDLVLISEKAWRTGGSRMFLKVGSKVSVSDLLHGVIIQSGNDASVALAEHIAGSESAFSDIMNVVAKDLGMSNSNFTDATGLPDENHYSSAKDMALLAQAIIYNDPEHYSLYKQKEFFWNNIKQPNRNLLLWRDSSVDGLKTGHTEEAGYCLAASAKRGNQRMIAVVFGADSEQSRAEQTQKLLNYGFRFFETETFYEKNIEITQAHVWKGELSDVKVGLRENLTMTLPRGQIDKLDAKMVIKPNLVAPISKGEEVGQVEVILDGKIIKEAPLIALDSVNEGSFFRKLIDSIKMLIQNLINKFL